MTSWIIETLLASTALMLLVIVIRNPVARHFGARTAYALWLIPALRMVLPPLPAAWLAGQELALSHVIVLPQALPSAMASSTISLPLLVLGLWAVGALAFFGWHSMRYLNFVDAAQRDADWLHEEDRVEIASSPVIASPVAFGFLSRIVMLPSDFRTRFDPAEQRLALSHELAHHRRLDLFSNYAALIILALHWFNPIAHYAYRAFRTDQEAACDADIVTGATAEERHAYGRALLKSATGGAPLAACSAGLASTIKARLERLSRSGNPVSKWRYALLPVTLGGLAVTASIAGSPAPLKHFVEKPFALPQLAAFAPTAQPTKVYEKAVPPAPIAVEASLATVEKDGAEVGEKAAAVARQAELPSAQGENAGEVAEQAAAAEKVAATAGVAAQQAASNTELFNAKCQNATSRHLFVQRNGDRQVVVITCDDMISLKTDTRTREALTLARAEVEQMDILTPEQRAAVLEGVDKALARLASQGPISHNNNPTTGDA